MSRILRRGLQSHRPCLFSDNLEWGVIHPRTLSIECRILHGAGENLQHVPEDLLDNFDKEQRTELKHFDSII